MVEREVETSVVETKTETVERTIEVPVERDVTESIVICDGCGNEVEYPTVYGPVQMDETVREDLGIEDVSNVVVELPGQTGEDSHAIASDPYAVHLCRDCMNGGPGERVARFADAAGDLVKWDVTPDELTTGSQKYFVMAILGLFGTIVGHSLVIGSWVNDFLGMATFFGILTAISVYLLVWGVTQWRHYQRLMEARTVLSME